MLWGEPRFELGIARNIGELCPSFKCKGARILAKATRFSWFQKELVALTASKIVRRSCRIDLQDFHRFRDSDFEMSCPLNDWQEAAFPYNGIGVALEWCKRRIMQYEDFRVPPLGTLKTVPLVRNNSQHEGIRQTRGLPHYLIQLAFLIRPNPENHTSIKGFAGLTVTNDSCIQYEVTCNVFWTLGKVFVQLRQR